ncbi:MAG: hypothetical protein WCH34_02805 [Bacteroidota bacterium]
MKTRILVLLIALSINCFSQSIDYIDLMTKSITAKQKLLEDILIDRGFISLDDSNYSKNPGYFAQNYQSIKSEPYQEDECTFLCAIDKFYFINPDKDILLIFKYNSAFFESKKGLEIRVTNSNKQSIFESIIRKLDSSNDYYREDSENGNIFAQFYSKEKKNGSSSSKYFIRFITPPLGNNNSKVYKIQMCEVFF